MEVKDLCKVYHGRPVLQNLSFAAGVGITAIWAPSGAGKTTLLRLLLGLEKPDGGRLVGTDLRWSAVFQEDRLLESCTVEENIMLSARNTKLARKISDFEILLVDNGSVDGSLELCREYEKKGQAVWELPVPFVILTLH